MFTKIKSIKKIKNCSLRYDIQVANNYNYYANGILVHNCTMYRDHIHARSLDSRHHWTRDWVKSFHGTIAHNIPEGFRICGENVYAKHSVGYDNLETYFYGFSVWNEDTCLSWDDTLEYFSLLGIIPVKVLYRGTFSMQALINVQKQIDFNVTEGYVMRKIGPFNLNNFKNNVGKFVRKNHVQTDQHWMYDANIEPNKLKQL